MWELVILLCTYCNIIVVLSFSLITILFSYSYGILATLIYLASESAKLVLLQNSCCYEVNFILWTLVQ